MKLLLNLSLYLKCFHVVCVGEMNQKCQNKSSGPFSSPKLMGYTQNLKWDQNSIVTNGKHTFLDLLINSYNFKR